MAGEIGASVIVVKEIEVPPVMVALADKLSGYLDPETGEWADKMINKRPRAPRSDWSDTPADTEDDFSDDESTPELITPAMSSVASPYPAFTPSVAHSVFSNSERPATQPSPAIFTLDDDLALFSMEPEPDYSDTETKAPADPEIPDLDVDMWVDLEISSVFKPRGGRRRGHSMNAAVAHFGKRAHKSKQKTHHPWHGTSHTSAKDDPETKELRAQNRRIARDKRREERRRALQVPAQVSTSASAVSSVPVDVSVQFTDKEADSLVSGLTALQITAEETGTGVSQLVAQGVTDTSTAEEDIHGEMGPVAHAIEGKLSGSGNLEPRLIVEAMVVRKLSVDEGLFQVDFANLDSFMVS